MFLVLCSFVSAVQYSTNPEDYYFDSVTDGGTGFNITDGINSSDIGLDGSPAVDGQSYETRGWVLGGAGTNIYSSDISALGSLSMKLNAVSANINLGDNSTFIGSLGVQLYDPGGNRNSLMVVIDVGGGTQLDFGLTTGAEWEWDSGSACNENTITRSNGWHSMTLNYTSSATASLFIDGVLCHKWTGLVGIREVFLNEGGAFDTYYDDFWMADGDRPLAPEPPPTATATPTIVPPSPPDNANNRTNQTLNVTHPTINNDVTYYLYFNDSSILTEEHLVLNNVARTGDEYRSFITSVSVDGDYFYKWKVRNTSSGIFSGNTTQRTWTLDTTNPTITLNNNNNFSIDNSTILSSLLVNLSIDITFFDTNLYQTLINITNETGDSVFYILNTSIGGKTSANYSRFVNITDWALGDYIIKLSATDSHTANSIRDYDVRAGFSYFRYTTEEGNVITIRSDTLPLTKRTTKLKDRYDFEFNYLFQKDTYKFIIESYNKIDYIEDSEYKAHFVIMGNNGGNWIDFENPNLQSKDYVVTKIDDYTYEVEVTANGIKSFTFNSLGGLNRVEDHYKIRLGAVIDVWVYDVVNYPDIQLNATATIGTQFDNSISNLSGARLINITKDITTLTLNASGFGFEDKTINITEKYHNLSFNMSPTSATQLYFYDEKSEDLIIGETFSVYLETSGFSQTYSATTNPHTITGLTNGFYKLKASSSNYPERQYLNLNVSNVTTTNLNIYMINNTIGNEVTFTIRGSGGNNLDNADINFFRIIGGTNTLIAEENTDFAGQAKLSLDPNYEYDITIIRSGYISRNITLEPSDTSYIIILLSGEAPYESVYQGVRFRFYYNGRMSISPPDILNITNSTQNITFEVDGTDIAEIGINFTNHPYTCTPASCSTTLAGAGQVKLGIFLNESGTFNTAYYFQKTGGKRIYVNDGLIKVIPFIFASLNSLPDFIIDMKTELSPNMRTFLVAVINVIAVGIGSSIGLAGTALVLPVLAVTVIASLPQIGLIHPFIGMIIAIFGVVLYVYSQSR